MPLHHFRSSSLVGNHVGLEFESETGAQIALTIPLESANQLIAGLLNALRSAEKQGSQIPRIDLGDQMIEINDLPVDQWRVTEAPDEPGRVFLHLLAAGGLYLTYSFGTNATRFVGEALAATAALPQNSQTSGTRN